MALRDAPTASGTGPGPTASGTGPGPTAPGTEPRPGPSGDRDERGENELQRLDRNWGELLQELRVVQTGVQLLTGFLLTLPFQQRFDRLTSFQRDVYLVTLALAATATALLIAPVAVHRMVFRLHARKPLVALSHRLALLGTGMLGLALLGVVVMIFDVVASGGAAVVAGTLTVVVVATLWLVVPLVLRHRAEESHHLA